MPSIGQSPPRVDGVAKVTGRVKYVGDEVPAGVAHAVVVRATIARGRVRSIDATAATARPGVLAVMTHANFPKRADAPVALKVNGRCGNRLAGSAGQQRGPLRDDRVTYPGEPVAVVVAGSAAAIANAVYHATGRRVRDLSITPDKLG